MPLAGLLSLGRRTLRPALIRHAPPPSQLPTATATPSARSLGLFSRSLHVKSGHRDSSPSHPVQPSAPSHSHAQDTPAHTPDEASDTTPQWHFAFDPRIPGSEAIYNRRIEQLTAAESSTLVPLPSTTLQARALPPHHGTQQHAHDWLHVLSMLDSLQAARLLTSSHDPPLFVYHTLLNRPFIQPAALKLLLAYLPRWHSVTLGVASSDGHHIDASPILLVFERLLRHCRRVWPQAIEPLAVFLTHHLRLPKAVREGILDDDMSSSAISRLTIHYNHALHLLSSFSSISPFKNAVFHEAAQAVILKHMADHTPPLVINREGYRAVTRVQLANRKSSSEQEWARLKSPSWPPWKEDRTGMDARVGLEYGVSRAHHILNRMKEAGYSLQYWERVAMIYAGWDTDHSPTIQTRILFPHFPEAHYTRHLWVARIRTTRTAQQAWACFLAYQDEQLPPDDQVYHAMFEVLVEERKRLRLGEENVGHEADNDGPHPLYPGDTKEIGSPPSSAHQLTYVRVEVPSIQQLFDCMREDRCPASDATLSLLLNSAESLAEGLAYLQTCAHGHHGAISTLLSSDVDHQVLSTLPDPVFSAYIHLLCRFPHIPLEDGPRSKWHYGDVAMDFRLSQPIARALFLLVEQRRQYRPAWNRVFDSLARKTAPALGSSWRNLYLKGRESLRLESRLYDKIFALNLTRHVVVTMRSLDLTIDIDAFLDICVVTEHAASAAYSIFERLGSDPKKAVNAIDARLIEKAVRTIREAPLWIQKMFQTLVEGEQDVETSTVEPGVAESDAAFSRLLECSVGTLDFESRATASEVALPRLLTVPGPAVLHAYVRALGLLRDYDGLITLVHWMIKFRSELADRCVLDRRGIIMMRRTITALRVFMEGRWEPSTSTSSGDSFPSAASPEQIDEIATIIGDVGDWGGWPSDEEVALYVDIGHSMA